MKIKNNMVTGNGDMVYMDARPIKVKGYSALQDLCKMHVCNATSDMCKKARLVGEYVANYIVENIPIWNCMADYYSGMDKLNQVNDLLEKGFTDDEREYFWIGFDSCFPEVYQQLINRVVYIISESRENYEELSADYISEDYKSSALLYESGSVIKSVQSLLNFAVSDTISYAFNGTIDGFVMDEMFDLQVLELLSNTIVGGDIRWHLVSKTNFYKELLLEQGRDINEF